MDIIDAAIVGALIEVNDHPTVSIYLPTYRAGAETQQNPIRLKNLLDEARDELSALGLRRPEVAKVLDPASQLLGDHGFWLHQEDGLAVFLTGADSRWYRLPQSFPELVVVGDRFYLKPLISVMSRGERFYILALSQNHVRLLWGSRHRVGEIELGEDVPESLAAALWFEDPERSLQFHPSAPRSGGGMTATFHGHGMGKDTTDDRLGRFLRAVDKGISHIIEKDAPLVLAGVDDLVARFRGVSKHGVILEGAVAGNVEEAKPADLHPPAWEIAASYFSAERAEAAAAYGVRSQPVASTVEELVPMAYQSRIDAVFIAAGATTWGSIDPDGWSVVVHEERHRGDEELLDAIAVETWKHGGKVYVVDRAEVPGGAELAAVLRY